MQSWNRGPHPRLFYVLPVHPRILLHLCLCLCHVPSRNLSRPPRAKRLHPVPSQHQLHSFLNQRPRLPLPGGVRLQLYQAPTGDLVPQLQQHRPADKPGRPPQHAHHRLDRSSGGRAGVEHPDRQHPANRSNGRETADSRAEYSS